MRLATGWELVRLWVICFLPPFVKHTWSPNAALLLRASHRYCRAQEWADRTPCALMAPRPSRWLYVMLRFHEEPRWWDVEVECGGPPPDPASLPRPQGADAFGGKQAGSACTPFSAPRQAGQVRVGGRAGGSGPFCPSVRGTRPVSSPSPGHVPKSPPRPQQIPTPFSKPQGGIGS